MRRICFLSILVFALADAAMAQTIRGRVLDDVTNEAVEDATVLLLDERGRPVGRTRTSAAGLFEFTPRSGGHYSLRVQRIGYATHQAPPVELASGESVEVEFRLSIEGVLLAPITVLGRQGGFARQRGREQFEYFRGLGGGYFVDSAMLAELQPRVATDAFREVPSIVLDRTRDGNDIPVPFRGWGCLVVFLDHHMRPVMTVIRPGARRPGADAIWTGSGDINRRMEASIGASPVTILAPARRTSLDHFREQGQWASAHHPWIAPLNEIVSPESIRGVEVYLRVQELPQELREVYGSFVNPPEVLGTCSVARLWTDGAW